MGYSGSAAVGAVKPSRGSPRALDEMRLPLEKAEQVLSLLIEGMTIGSVEWVTDVHRDTVLRLLVLAGSAGRSC